MDDAELARRSLLGFGEMLATLGRCGVGPEAEVRRPGAVGARIDIAAGDPWCDAAVVPLGAVPPADDACLPGCLWSVADAAPGRVEDPGIATPCMGLMLDDSVPVPEARSEAVEAPPLRVVGAVNARAYRATSGPVGRLIGSLRDARVRTYGLRAGEAFVCVALTLAIDDDVSIQYVATEAGYRRRGLASRLVTAAVSGARREGMRSATLQASPDGMPVYERLGFRRIATLHAYLRP